MTDKLLSCAEAADFLTLSMSTLNKYRVHGGGPRFLKLGRAVRYARSDLEAWIDQSRRASTSETASSD